MDMNGCVIGIVDDITIHNTKYVNSMMMCVWDYTGQYKIQCTIIHVSQRNVVSVFSLEGMIVKLSERLSFVRETKQRSCCSACVVGK
jgi:hypothetical protein